MENNIITYKTAFTTGARGLGLALIIDLLKKNYKVYVGLRNSMQYIQNINNNIENNSHFKVLTQYQSLNRLHFIELDMENIASINEAVKTIYNSTNFLHLVINNAGITQSEKNLEDVNYENMIKLFKVNLIGPTMLLKGLLPLLKVTAQNSTEIVRNVFISSMRGSIELNDSGKQYSYRSSKIAINMLNRSFGIDYAKSETSPGILSLAIHPGFVRTDMTKSHWNGKADDELPTEMITASFAAESIIDTIFSKDLEDSGKFFNYDGSAMPY